MVCRPEMYIHNCVSNTLLHLILPVSLVRVSQHLLRELWTNDESNFQRVLGRTTVSYLCECDHVL